MFHRSTRKRKFQGGNTSPGGEVICSISIGQIEIDSFFSSMRSLYENNLLCDIAFKTQTDIFHAHKIFLASANSFLSALILSGMQESFKDVIEIDVPSHLFKFILDYLYGLRIDIPSSEIIPLLGLASSYSMIRLRDKLGDILAENLSLMNCCAIFSAAGDDNSDDEVS
jgi:hypothetical protein